MTRMLKIKHIGPPQETDLGTKVLEESFVCSSSLKLTAADDRVLIVSMLDVVSRKCVVCIVKRSMCTYQSLVG